MSAKAAVVLCSSVAAVLVLAGPAPADWSQYRGDPARTGSAAWAGGSAPKGERVWRAYIGQRAMVHASPVVGPDGTIYVAARQGSASLLAFNPDGGRRWAATLDGYRVDATPAVRDDGRLVVVASSSHDHRSGFVPTAKNSNERVLLVWQTTGHISQSSGEYQGASFRAPLLDEQGNAYFSWGDYLYRFDRYAPGFAARQVYVVTSTVTGSAGDCPWSPYLPLPCLSPPPSAPPTEPPLGFAPTYSPVCKDVAGSGAWSYRIWPQGGGWKGDRKQATTPALGKAGRQYMGVVAGDGFAAAAFAQDGTRLWQTKLDGVPVGPPALGRGTRRGGDGETFSCVRKESGRQVLVRDATSWADEVYIATGSGYHNGRSAGDPATFDSGTLYALDYTGRIRWQRRLSGRLGAPVVVRTASGDMVVVTSGGGNAPNLLTAFRESGSVAWTLPLDGPAYGSPAIADGRIYVATTHSLYAVR